jgi:hypothetical protein
MEEDFIYNLPIIYLSQEWIFKVLRHFLKVELFTYYNKTILLYKMYHSNKIKFY